MDLMARYEDNHFDLAIVDPPYGIGMGGGKFGNIFRTQKKLVYPRKFEVTTLNSNL